MFEKLVSFVQKFFLRAWPSGAVIGSLDAEQLFICTGALYIGKSDRGL